MGSIEFDEDENHPKEAAQEHGQETSNRPSRRFFEQPGVRPKIEVSMRRRKEHAQCLDGHYSAP